MSSIWSKLSLSSSSKEDGKDFLASLKFESCLGLGGFGIVLLAIDPTTSATNPNPTHTAVKFIFASEESDPKEEKRLLRECQLASTLDHQNIVKVLNFAGKQFKASEVEKILKNLSKDDHRSLSFRDMYIAKAKRYKSVDSIAIQMELCGETLRKWLHQDHEKNDVTVHRVQFRICRGIVFGLKYLHDKKIIHRDLKPENIMFSKVGFQLPVKIGDFGLCRTLHSRPESHTSSLTSRTGTLEYMASEAYNNDYSFQVDLFSSGLVLWEVVQLIKFQKRRNLFDALVNERDEGVIPEIFSPLGPCIVGLTKKKPAERVQDLDQVLRVLHEIYQNVIRFPKTSEELEAFLKDVERGDRIVLGKGVFQGEFILRADGVEIVGQGSGKTVLKGLEDKVCLTVAGSDCAISGLSIISVKGNLACRGINLKGSRNKIHNVAISGGVICVSVEGHENVLEELTISIASNGIQVYGSNNTLNHIKVEEIVSYGIWVNGSGNRLSHIHVRKRTHGCRSHGVWFDSSGSVNTISKLTCSGYSRDRGDWALVLDSSDSSVQDSDCGPVSVGGRDSSLSNVNCGEVIQIQEKATGVRLTGCRGQKLIFQTPVVTMDCHFDQIIDKR